MDLLVYLMQDGAYWIKVRATYPADAHTLDGMDALVRSQLAG